MFCKKCYTPMENVMSFSKGRREKFCRCPKCCEETKHMKMNDEELSFGELLHMEVNKRRR